MRRLLAAAAATLLLLTPTPTSAELSIEAQLAVADGIPRSIDAGFQQRALTCTLAMAAAETLHDCALTAGEAEIIGYNGGYPDPVAQVVGAWMASPDHRAIVVDPSYTRIGCGAAHIVIASSDRWFFDCYLAIPRAVLPPPIDVHVPPLVRPLPVPALIVPPPTLIPNTAYRAP